MVINTNISAQSSARLLAESSSMLSKSLARLSSGSKIVSPEDDAAGMAVSMSDSDRALYQKEFAKIGAYIDDLATKDFNGVSLFGGASLNVTTDSEGNVFSMTGVDLAASAYSTATSGDVSTTAGAVSALADVKDAIDQLASDRATV